MENKVIFNFKDKYLRKYLLESEGYDVANIEIPAEIKEILYTTASGSSEAADMIGDLLGYVTEKEYHDFFCNVCVGLQYGYMKFNTLPTQITSVSESKLGERPFDLDTNVGMLGINDRYINQIIRNKRNGIETMMMFNNSPRAFGPDEEAILIGVEAVYENHKDLGNEHDTTKLDYIDEAVKKMDLGKSSMKDMGLT